MATQSDEKETQTPAEPDPNSLGSDVFGDAGDSEDPLGLKDRKPEEGRKAKKGSEVKAKKETAFIKNRRLGSIDILWLCLYQNPA